VKPQTLSAKNTSQSFGWVSRLLHGLGIVLVLGLFALGLWMHDLDYYHAWYHSARDYHKSFGAFLVVLTLVRILWTAYSPRPAPLSSWMRPERIAAHLVQYTMLGLIVALGLSGYLITTAKGDPLVVAGLVAIPALIDGGESLEQFVAQWHERFALTLVGLAGLHAFAALLHQLRGRERLLQRMFWGRLE
jgi:cytochrome b561